MCPTRSPLNERSAEVNTSMMLPRRPIVTAADRSEMNAGGSGLTMDLGCVLRVHTGAISQASRTGLESNSVEPCALDGLGVVLAPSLAHVCHPATVQPLPRVDARDWAVFPVAPTHRIPLQYTYARARHVSARDALETKKLHASHVAPTRAVLTSWPCSCLPPLLRHHPQARSQRCGCYAQRHCRTPPGPCPSYRR